MAKRFTDTNKYKKSFIRGLPAAYKIFWDFLYHDCDHAGIWIVDFQVAQMYIGDDVHISRPEALDLFNTDEVRIVEFDNGKKWYIPSFVEFQYGILSENNRAHASVISILSKFSLLNNKGLLSSFQGAKDKELDKYKEKDKEKESGVDFLKDIDQHTLQLIYADMEKYLIPEMFNIYKEYHRGYPGDKFKDYEPLRIIGEFICKNKGYKYRPGNQECMDKILGSWRIIVEFISKDEWIRENYNISQVEKYIQSITIKMKKEINNRQVIPIGDTSLYEKWKQDVSNALLSGNDELFKELKKRKWG